MPAIESSKDRAYALHDQVLTVLESELSHELVSPKILELAMRFLKDNHVVVDLTKNSEGKPKLTVIPRLTPEELQQG